MLLHRNTLPWSGQFPLAAIQRKVQFNRGHVTTKCIPAGIALIIVSIIISDIEIVQLLLSSNIQSYLLYILGCFLKHNM